MQQHSTTTPASALLAQTLHVHRQVSKVTLEPDPWAFSLSLVGWLNVQNVPLLGHSTHEDAVFVSFVRSERRFAGVTHESVPPLLWLAKHAARTTKRLQKQSPDEKTRSVDRAVGRKLLKHKCNHESPTGSVAVATSPDRFGCCCRMELQSRS